MRATLLIVGVLLGVASLAAAGVGPVVAPEDVPHWPFARFVREYRRSYSGEEYEMREKLYEVRW